MDNSAKWSWMMDYCNKNNLNPNLAHCWAEAEHMYNKQFKP